MHCYIFHWHRRFRIKCRLLIQTFTPSSYHGYSASNELISQVVFPLNLFIPVFQGITWPLFRVCPGFPISSLLRTETIILVNRYRAMLKFANWKLATHVNAFDDAIFRNSFHVRQSHQLYKISIIHSSKRQGTFSWTPRSTVNTKQYASISVKQCLWHSRISLVMPVAPV